MDIVSTLPPGINDSRLNSGKRAAKTLLFRITDGPIREVIGREAWMLKQLIIAGTSGVTTLQHPGARLSHFVLKLRRAGLSIETIDERHAGEFSGRHGRYVLRSAVTIVRDAQS